MTTPRPFVARDRVRWADVDLVGIMRFSAFTRLVENAEQDLLREVGLPYAEIFQRPEVWMPRRALTIEYFAPARLDDELTLVTYVSRLGNTSLTLVVDVRSGGDGDSGGSGSGGAGVLVASATMTVVCVTAAEFAKRPLPGIVRTALAPYLLTVEQARALP